MTPITRAKLVVAGAGLAVFLAGVRIGNERVRLAGIILMAAAWALRFVPGTGASRPPASGEDA